MCVARKIHFFCKLDKTGRKLENKGRPHRRPLSIHGSGESARVRHTHMVFGFATGGLMNPRRVQGSGVQKVKEAKELQQLSERRIAGLEPSSGPFAVSILSPL